MDNSSRSAISQSILHYFRVIKPSPKGLSAAQDPLHRKVKESKPACKKKHTQKNNKPQIISMGKTMRKLKIRFVLALFAKGTISR